MWMKNWCPADEKIGLVHVHGWQGTRVTLEGPQQARADCPGGGDGRRGPAGGASMGGGDLQTIIFLKKKIEKKNT
jgi:hypothetical protein